MTTAFYTVVETHLAGDPMRPDVHWTSLSRPEIAAALYDQGHDVSVTVVDRVLEAEGFSRRAPQKCRTMGDAADRNAQFKRIAKLRDQFFDAGDPVLSMDTKKKEMLGDYARQGEVLADGRLPAWDHDFPTHSSGKVVPHGLYDLFRNEGYMHLGLSRDTSQFAADCLLDWWRQYGANRYPRTKRLLLLSDCGGSNGVHSDLYKSHLQVFADRSGLTIRVAHYPPYCSKYNPIERRLFPHLTRSCQCQFLHSAEQYRDLLRSTTTEPGLRVYARINRHAYELGALATGSETQRLHIRHDRSLSTYNYCITPN